MSTDHDTTEHVEPGVRWRDGPADRAPETNRARSDERAHSAATARRLDEMIRAAERVDWRRVPGVSPLTAAVVVNELDRARREIREGEP